MFRQSRPALVGDVHGGGDVEGAPETAVEEAARASLAPDLSGRAAEGLVRVLREVSLWKT